MWYFKNCKKNFVLDASVTEKNIESTFNVSFKFAQSQDGQVAQEKNAFNFVTFKDPSIYHNFANQALQNYLRTHPPAQAMKIALQLTKSELEKNSEPVRASNEILKQIYAELQNNLPNQSQYYQQQQQITQQQENQVRSKLYQEGLAIIDNYLKENKEPNEINSIIQSKLDSLFNNRHISQRVYNELINWFTMKIFQNK